MSCPELTAKLVEDIRARRHDLIVCNIANPDMVGHRGVLAAAIQAVEAVDVALRETRAAIESVGGEMLVPADHGNLEVSLDPGTGDQHNTQNVTPVPRFYVHTATPPPSA